MSHTAGLSGFEPPITRDRPLRLGRGVGDHLAAPGAVVGAGHARRATTPSPRATSRARSCAGSPAARSAPSSARRWPSRSAPTSTSGCPRRRTHRVAELVAAGRQRRRADRAVDPTRSRPARPRQLPARRRRDPHPRVARRRDPGRRRHRQRPLGRPGALGARLRRRGRRRPAHVGGRRRAHPRGADQRRRPGARLPDAVRHGLRPDERPGPAQPQPPGVLLGRLGRLDRRDRPRRRR